MDRRDMLQRAAAALFAAGVPFAAMVDGALAATPPAGLRRLGRPEPFDYAKLKGTARQLGNSAYKARPDALPPAIAGLNWDRWQSIRFRYDQSLWAADHLRYQVRFSHLGFTMKKPVRMYVIENGQVQELGFDRNMFDYSRSGLKPAQVPENLGFAGLRVNFHTDWPSDMASFEGASYFRAIDGDLQYGMSQRGLAVDTGMPYPEEFPEFIAYYLERPPEGLGPADDLWPARLAQRGRCLPLRDRGRRYLGHGCGCGAVPAQVDRPHRYRTGHQHVPVRAE